MRLDDREDDGGCSCFCFGRRRRRRRRENDAEGSHLGKPGRVESPVEMSDVETTKKEEVLETTDTERPMTDIGRPSVDIVRRPEAINAATGSTEVEGYSAASMKSEHGPQLFKNPFPRTRLTNNASSKRSLDITRTAQPVAPHELIQRPTTEAIPDTGRQTPEPKEITDVSQRAATPASHPHSGWTWFFRRGRTDSQSSGTTAPSSVDDDIPVPANSVATDLEDDIEDCMSSNKSGFISDEQWLQILRWMPLRFRVNDAAVVFRASVDGYNLGTLRRKCADQSPLIMLIKTITNPPMFIGAFLPTEMLIKPGRYTGTGEAYIFRLDPDPMKFEWEPGQESLFLNNERNSFSVGGGGGVGIGLDANLHTCISERCNTFCNPPLFGEETESVIADIEVISFSPSAEFC